MIDMNQHLTTNEIKSFAAGELDYSKLLQFSAHILDCQICLNVLNEIDPNLLQDAQQMEDERNKTIKGDLHYSFEQINKYYEGKIKLSKRTEMSHHFRKCKKCVSELNKIDPDYTRLLSDLKLLKSNKELSFLEKPGLLPKLNLLIPVSVLSLLLIGVLVYIIFIPNQTINQAYLDNKQILNLPIQKNSNKNEKVLVNSNTNGKVKTNKNSDTNTKANKDSENEAENTARILKIIPINKNSNKILKQEKIITSESRSTDKQNCEEGKIIVETPIGETIIEKEPTLKWKPVQKAESYQIYVYDEIQIPIAESKIQKENFFKVTKPLELNKSYNWVVIANLEDGKTVSSGLVKFKVGNKAIKRNKLKTENIETRCIQ